MPMLTMEEPDNRIIADYDGILDQNRKRNEIILQKGEKTMQRIYCVTTVTYHNGQAVTETRHFMNYEDARTTCINYMETVLKYRTFISPIKKYTMEKLKRFKEKEECCFQIFSLTDTTDRKFYLKLESEILYYSPSYFFDFELDN